MNAIHSSQLEAPTSRLENASPPFVANPIGTVKPPVRVLSTLNSDGSRRWLKPRVSSGRFLTARRIVAYVLIAVFTLLPHIAISGKPAVLLDLVARRFTILGVTFLPTDTVLLALLLLGVFVTVFLLTALLGRVWCGWACPQTVYLEFVFRPLERLFDGLPGHTTRGGFQGSDVAKVLKYLSFLIIAFGLAHTFLAYFVPVGKLATWITGSPFNHPVGFLIVAAMTGLMLFDFGWFREQLCIVACPYGRFQSVMLDRQSLIVSYDTIRGEPRGKKKRYPSDGDDARLPLPVMNRSSSAAGDCVDCRMCVTTCPTGIDIRDGLQMECIGCAQCIDACDAVMDKVGRSRGLIRYSSQAAMAREGTRMLRPRVIIYPAVLIIIAGLFITVLVNRSKVDVTVLRGLGRPFIEMPSDEVGNQVRIKIVNRTDRTVRYTIGAEPSLVRVQAEDNPVTIGPGDTNTTPAMIVIRNSDLRSEQRHVTLVITGDDKSSVRREWELLGPANLHARDQSSNTAEAGAHE